MELIKFPSSFGLFCRKCGERGENIEVFLSGRTSIKHDYISIIIIECSCGNKGIVQEYPISKEDDV